MKRLLLILILVFAVMSVSDARMSGVMLSGAGTSTGGSCTCGTASDSCVDDDPYYIAMCYYADRIGVSQQFTSTSAQTVCKATLRLKKGGTITNSPTLQVCIYTDSTNKPGTLVGTCSTNTVNSNDLTTSYQDIDFTGISATLSSSTNYHITLISSAQCTDLVIWGMADSGCGVGSLYSAWFSGTEWTAQSNSANFEFVLTKCN